MYTSHSFTGCNVLLRDVMCGFYHTYASWMRHGYGHVLLAATWLTCVHHHSFAIRFPLVCHLFATWIWPCTAGCDVATTCTCHSFAIRFPRVCHLFATWIWPCTAGCNLATMCTCHLQGVQKCSNGKQLSKILEIFRYYS